MTQTEALKAAINHIDRAIDEPNNTMSDGKALKEIMRQLNLARAALGEALAQSDEKPICHLFGTLPVYDRPRAQPEQEPVAWEGGEGWESLAWELCANENGEEACNELIWEGGPIPEPWGERWLKYEDEAKRLIALVQKHTSPPQRKPLTDEEIILIVAECAASHQHTDIHFARAIERAHGIKELV